MAKRRRKSKGFGWRAQILLIIAFFISVMFSAISIVLVIGMIPTIVATIVDRSEDRLKMLTVGALNLAGCMPFLLEIFKKGNDIGTAVGFITQPRTIVIMYMAAAMGYMIDWAMTGIVSSIMVQKGKARLKEIEKQQKMLSERWGVEVTGTIQLDEFGFARDNYASKELE